MMLNKTSSLAILLDILFQIDRYNTKNKLLIKLKHSIISMTIRT